MSGSKQVDYAVPRPPLLPLKPRWVRHSYSVALRDGEEHAFAVTADLTGSHISLIVTLPERFDDDPIAVPPELLEHVHCAMELMRHDLAAEGRGR